MYQKKKKIVYIVKLTFGDSLFGGGGKFNNLAMGIFFFLNLSAISNMNKSVNFPSRKENHEIHRSAMGKYCEIHLINCRKSADLLCKFHKISTIKGDKDQIN